MRFGRLRQDVVIGVDGCPGGWVTAVWEPQEPSLTVEIVTRLIELIERAPGVAIGVDIPIGLTTSDPRTCDVAARQSLGPERASSVFPAPCRGILRLGLDDAATSARSRELTDRSISQQVYHIIPKLAEVDDVFTPELQHRVVEIHPEVSFHVLARGRPMQHRKRRLAGFVERRDQLRRVVPPEAIPETRTETQARVAASMRYGRGAGADDVLDAVVAAWSGYRFAADQASRVPPHPEVDACGPTMAIVV